MPDSEPATWRTLFPYDPYDAQEQGIERAIDVVGDGGYYLLEGACGTGKTAIALTAALALIDDPTSQFERAVVLTSVKQQLEIFQSDLEAINAAAPNEHSSVTLVGKADMCSYVASGAIDERDIYGRCSQLRDQTRTLIDDDGRPSEVATAMSLAGGAEAGEHDRPLQTGAADAPYRPGIPERDGTEYCPFYAQYLGDEMGDGSPIEPDGVRRPESLHDTATEFGNCPHAVMADLAEDVDVVIGNYQHAFDPITVTAMTGHLLADSTLVIADEAHGIVEQVRDRLRESVSLRSIDTGIDELRTVERWAEGGANVRRERRALTREVLEDCEVPVDAIGCAADFLEALREAVAGTIDNHRSDAEGDRWADRLARDSAGGNQRLDDGHLDSVTIPLRDPERAEEDQLTLWADLQGWGDAWDRASRACQAAGSAIETVNEKLEGDALAGDPTTRSVGRLLGRWSAVDHEEFLRTIQLDPRENRLATPPGDAPWRVAYNAELAIENCLPRRAIAETFSAFGGGILMSATLAPMDVFRTVTGLDLLAGGDVGGEGGSGAASAATESAVTETGRRVESSVFGMGFPTEHRESLAVDLPAYTYSNRGPAGADNEVRDAYGRVLVDVAATTPGNVLIAMPSYAEAEWAAEVVAESSDVSKDVLCDEPSTNAVTERRKDAFFAGDGKVLTTSLRGTLTEGVDYPGEKLRAALVCGVPIVNTGSALPTAIETAYDSRFGPDVGFEYAFTVPAVRKARQALGRVIRGPEDVGVRVLVDERYATTRPWNSVREYLPENEREAFEPTQPNDVADRLAAFWREHR